MHINFVKETIEKNRSQPESLRKANLEPITEHPRLEDVWKSRRRNEINKVIVLDYKLGEEWEDSFRSACSGRIKRNAFEANAKQPSAPKCHFVHHFDPYQRVGPFHFEVHLYSPVRTTVHNLLTENEMQWIMEYSRSKLSSRRIIDDGTITGSKKGRGRSVDKAIQTVFNDISYNETLKIVQTNEGRAEPPLYAALPLEDPYTFYIIHEILFQVYSVDIKFHTSYK